MVTKIYNRKNLADFIHSAEFHRLEHIPISPQRAVSQINNPRASDDDVLLVVQLDGEKLAGYLGVLPDVVFYQHEQIKIGWLSCFWVDEAYRKTGVSASLFLQIMDSWDYRIIITNFVPSLTSLYLKTGMFRPVLVKTGIRAYMRFNLSDVLPSKRRLFAYFRPLFRIADTLFNTFGDLRFLFFRGFALGNATFEYLEEMDNSCDAYIHLHNQSNWSNREAPEIRWILKYPWIKEASKPDTYSKKYYFSSISKRFIYRIIKLNDLEGSISGLVMICIRNNQLTVPYIFASSDQFKIISKILANIMIENRLSMITVFHEPLGQSVSQLTGPFIFRKRIHKPYLISKKLNFIDQPNFQDGDGDCAFY